ncbi:MAG: TAT-variant-translocated molybdopterin oxidoreductase [Bacteroidetes bacterium]|nr:TAT-variant-translocated molybdopterin oxidoreductase [Bacteroidota bacterium]
MKKYWKSIDELRDTPEIQKLKENEFAELLPVHSVIENQAENGIASSRRDFLKLMGFSLSAAALSACEAPVVKSIPYLVKPEEIIPGVANWYASNYFDGTDYCPILIKTREGRPIKIEGNKDSKITGGAINARVQASLLSLYDTGRYKEPLKNGQPATWDECDREIAEKLSSISARGGNIRIVTSSLASPSAKKIIGEFIQRYSVQQAGDELTAGAEPDSAAAAMTQKFPANNVKHIVYDAVSCSAIIRANEKFFGKTVIPSYRFDKAETIVSIGADFLANWISSIEYAQQYGKNKRQIKHFQYEAALTLTGCNADARIPVKPSQYGNILLGIYNIIAKETGAPVLSVNPVEFSGKIEKSAMSLLGSKGKSLVVCGTNNIAHQIITNAINQLLGNYGNTIDLNNPDLTRQNDDSSMQEFITELKNGKIDAALFWNVNPVYSHPDGKDIENGLKNTGLTVSFALSPDETSSAIQYVCPDNHFLESWNDASPKPAHYGLCQPVISPLYKTRQFQESFLKWMGSNSDYYSYIRNYWKENIFPQQNKTVLFETFWKKALHDGIVEPESLILSNTALPVVETNNVLVEESVGKISGASEKSGRFEIVFYQKTATGNGSHANNPWLQELPDPVSKVCWDNYLTMSPKQMEELGLNMRQGQEEVADVVELTVSGNKVRVPVFPLPGQTYGTVGLAVGYGRTVSGKVGKGIGVNAYPLLRLEDGAMQYESADASVSVSVGKYNLASTQVHHTMMGRNIVRETTLEEYSKNPKAGNEETVIAMHGGEKLPPALVNMWKDHEKNDQWWNLSIDLSACIGCGACTISCQVENNLPVVGKDEINRSRDMQWLRIDRYFSSDEKDGDLDKMEIPSDAENLQVSFQPVMCQHCNHAPCETVCPVAATTHSTDGLNMMAYNRCVGTRYCANNCPYKVRRFNWFEYDKYSKFKDINPAQDDMGRMTLNPDVVVRSRGVMEKCTMCYQRIQDGKLKAKREGRPLKDGEIATACEAVCPTHAITFGNALDESSRVAKLKPDDRKYTLLDELDTQPSVFYLTKVRNV